MTRSRTTCTALTGTLALLALVGVPRPSRAQSQAQVRTGLIREADVARAAGDHARALDLLRAAWRIAPSLSVRWGIALEALQSGDLVTAQAEAEACQREAATSTASEAATAAVECRAIVDRVLAREVPPPAEPRPATVHPTPRATPPSPSGPGAGPVVLLVAGGAGLVAAGVLWGLYAAGTSGCDLQGANAFCRTSEDANRALGAAPFAWAGDVAMGVGVAAVATGILWWVLARRAPEHPAVSLGPGGIVWRGAF